MKDRFFIDTNIALYLLDKNNELKKKIALTLLEEVPFISPQVIFECLNVCLRKLKFDNATAVHFVKTLLEASYLQDETEEVVHTAIRLFSTGSFQSFDSKIVAAALAADCAYLYSEDMQHGLIVENRLTIINPFVVVKAIS